MGSALSNLFFENDEKLEQYIKVEFCTNIPIVDVELKPQVTLSHIGPCIFRWFRINTESEVKSIKDLVKVPEVTLVSRALSYRPVSPDAGHQLLFFARLMKNSIFQEELTLFQKTIPRPENVPVREDQYNKSFSLDGSSRSLKLSCGSYSLDGDLFGEDIVAEEKMEELCVKFPSATPSVFNFLYRRNLLARELNTLHPDILFLQRLNKKEHINLKSKLFKEGYSCIQLWNTSAELSHVGMVTYFKRDKLTKVREYKIMFDKFHEYDPKKKEAQFMITPESYGVIEDLCRANKVEMKDLKFNGSTSLLLELDLKSEYFVIPVKNANEDHDNEVTFFVVNMDFRNGEVESAVEVVLVLSFLADLVRTCKRRFCLVVAAANLIYPEVYDLLMKAQFKGKVCESIDSANFKFRDSYHNVFNDFMKYNVSSKPVMSKRVTDYIFFQQQPFFDLVKVSDVPTFKEKKDAVEKLDSFPNLHYVSSHICLVAEYALQFKKYPTDTKKKKKKKSKKTPPKEKKKKKKVVKKEEEEEKEELVSDVSDMSDSDDDDEQEKSKDEKESIVTSSEEDDDLSSSD